MEEVAITHVIKKFLRQPQLFNFQLAKFHMRQYQLGVMDAILESVMGNLGRSFVVMFPRQSGKNELQAHLEVYLMTLLSRYNVEMIKVAPTLEPQARISMNRFEKVARRNPLVNSLWKKEGGNSFRVGGVRLTFLSGAPESNIVGATASGVLEVDEAQQVGIDKFDRDISPMCASTCATQIFWGTAWTSTTLLGRELRASLIAERKDGARRVFRINADEVCREVPTYKRYVEEKIARQGRNHPMVRTQYFSEEIDGQGGMFPEERRNKMKSGLPPTAGPGEAGLYALLLDVAGEDEGVRSLTGAMSLANPARDATALTLVKIVLENGNAKALPVYHAVRRWQWIGASPAALHPAIREIALEWKVRAVVVDATGVGAGLASFLERALPGKVTFFTFNTTSKSKLGWDFLAITDSHRWQEPEWQDLPGNEQYRHQQEFFDQLAGCQFEVSDSASQTMHWGVPDGSRHPASGEPLHDDWVISAALSAVLEKMDWSAPAAPFVVEGKDPLKESEGKF